VSPEDLKIGGVYFQVTYEDREFTVPAVDPMIYLGADILEVDPADEPSGQPRYAFQDTVSFSHFGNAIEYQGDTNLEDEGAHVFSLTVEDLECLFDLRGVVAELSLALDRAGKHPPHR
jgi:hypothetical protein